MNLQGYFTQVRTYLLFFIFTLFLPGALVAGDDILVAQNGDRLVGTIKRIERGIITFDTDYADSKFKIEWEKVQSIHSVDNFVIFMSRGERYNGSISLDSTVENHLIIIDDDIGEVSVHHDDIYLVIPYEDQFWSRFDANFDLGYTFTKASNNNQFNLSANLSYLAEKDQVTGFFSSVLNSTVVTATDSAGDEFKATSRTQRVNYGATYRRFIVKDWYGFATATFLSNDEQRLNLRSNLGGGIGTMLVANKDLLLNTNLALTWMNENFTDSETQNNAEAALGFEFIIFGMENISLETRVVGYSVLTDMGRYRADFRGALKWDLPWDFYIKLEYNHNFDSRPPNNAPNNDFVFITALGWEL